MRSFRGPPLDPATVDAVTTVHEPRRHRSSSGRRPVQDLPDDRRHTPASSAGLRMGRRTSSRSSRGTSTQSSSDPAASSGCDAIRLCARPGPDFLAQHLPPPARAVGRSGSIVELTKLRQTSGSADMGSGTRQSSNYVILNPGGTQDTRIALPTCSRRIRSWPPARSFACASARSRNPLPATARPGPPILDRRAIHRLIGPPRATSWNWPTSPARPIACEVTPGGSCRAAQPVVDLELSGRRDRTDDPVERHGQLGRPHLPRWHADHPVHRHGVRRADRGQPNHLVHRGGGERSCSFPGGIGAKYYVEVVAHNAQGTPGRRGASWLPRGPCPAPRATWPSPGRPEGST